MRKKRAVKPVKVIGYLVLAAFIVFLGYSVYTYESSVEKIEEFEVCYEDRCIKTFHTHSMIDVRLCGERILFPLERGPLEGPHTHKERNMIHFHERLPYDPKTGILLETAPLKVGSFLSAMDMRFSKECVGKYCNGDVCPNGKRGQVKMSVNGVQNDEFENYAWEDGDDIQITFE